MTEFRPDVENESRLNMFLADVFYKFTLGVASRSQPVRGGVLGAGAAAVLSNPAQNGIANNTGAGLNAQYNRPAAVTNAALNKNNRIAVPYVPDAAAPRYTPSRDPAVILQQQQAAQQAQLLQQAQLGRGPYTPQQLQVQQQLMHAQQLQARSSQRGMTPFPTIPENASVNAHRPQLKHFSSGSPFSLHDQQDEQPQQQSNNGYEAHLSPDLRAQRNSLGSYADVDDTATLPQYGSALLSRNGNSATARQASQSFTEGMYPNSYNNGNNLRNGSSNNHYQQQSSPVQAASALQGMSSLSIAPSPWMHPPSSYNGSTPNGNGHNSSSGDWLNPGNLSRLSSSHSTSTMSMLGAFHSTSSHVHTNSFNNSSNSLGNSSFLVPGGGSGYDDSMDKLIGVTNIGLVPAFDDPQDPLYSED